METTPLISIAIPTYNRSAFLENLLSSVLPQIAALPETVRVCISNNASTDTTREVVLKFSQKYPQLITYFEQEKNVGHDGNVLRVMEMSSGQFTWLLGDDDLVVSGGLARVVDFVKNRDTHETGLIILGHQRLLVDPLTGKSTVYFRTIEALQPDSYEMKREQVIGIRSENSFLSVMVFNNVFLKKILQEEKIGIGEAAGAGYIQTFILQLMLITYPHMKVVKLNQLIIDEPLHYFKFYVEDKFKLYYGAWRKCYDLLLKKQNIGSSYRGIILNQKRQLKKRIIKEMGLMKAFGSFTYLSFSGCLQLFFSSTNFLEAIYISLFFMLFYITPGWLLRVTYKLFVMAKYQKHWQEVWLHATVVNAKMSQGSRRLLY